MRARTILTASVILALAVAATIGWGWGLREHRSVAALGFVEQRIAILEQENARLHRVLADKQSVEDLAATRSFRKEIEVEVASLRGLPFLQPVDYREMPRSELPAVLRAKLSQQIPDQEFGNAGFALAALGLLPTNIDLKKTYLDLLGEQIGAFYDQHERQLFMFSGQSLASAQNRVVLAHELTHALEDQHFHLASLPLEAKNNDDRVLAATALVEGDATLVMNVYMSHHIDGAAVRDTLASALTTDVRQLVAAPRFLRETLLFPYLRGQEFCSTLFERGGWKALGEAFAKPPSSTAQILHPELFFGPTREEPIAVDFPDTDLLGQAPIDNNVLGEFGARQLFAVWLHDDARASSAAAGWRGDRYVVYRDNGAANYAWKIVCRDDASAGAFFEAMKSSINARYREGGGRQVAPAVADPPALPASGTQAMIAAHLVLPGGREIEICRTPAREVIVIDAANNRWATALAGRYAPGVQFSNGN